MPEEDGLGLDALKSGKGRQRLLARLVEAAGPICGPRLPVSTLYSKSTSPTKRSDRASK
jgi:hypothetical protein